MLFFTVLRQSRLFDVGPIDSNVADRASMYCMYYTPELIVARFANGSSLLPRLSGD